LHTCGEIDGLTMAGVSFVDMTTEYLGLDAKNAALAKLARDR
jgi:hypothetical protein